MYICVKLPPRDLNSSLCPPHPTSTYTCGVTTAPRVHGNLFIYLKSKSFLPLFACYKNLIYLTKKSEPPSYPKLEGRSTFHSFLGKCKVFKIMRISSNWVGFCSQILALKVKHGSLIFELKREFYIEFGVLLMTAFLVVEEAFISHDTNLCLGLGCFCLRKSLACF